MYNLAHFSLSEMTACGSAIRKLGCDADTMETTASRIVRYFYDNFVEHETQQPTFTLVRFFKTHDFSDLSNNLQQVARRSLDNNSPSPDMKCLTLLGTAGDRFEWNHRHLSTRHQVIPLPSEQMVKQAPMMSQLLQQLGLSISNVIAPDPNLIVDLQERTYNVFHVRDAPGSPYIPDQTTFVQLYNIQSVLGFGGILPSGSLITIILFSRVSISRQTAELFKPLALNVKVAVLPFDHGPIFASVAS